MYRFLLSPRWMVLHVLVLVAVVVMINLGFWQLRRLEEKQDRNQAIETRGALAPVDIAELSDPSAPVAVGDELVYTAVTASGTYDAGAEVLLRSRDLDGRPGFWVLTPLDLGDGTAVVVNRGWIPFQTETDGSDIAFDTPDGPVEVTGILERHFGGARPAGDERTTIAHLDLEWFDEQVAADLHPVAIQLHEQSPPAGDLPVTHEPPELDEGPHLSYAVQWFLFAGVAVVGYPILLRTVAEQRTRGVGGAEPDADDDLAVERELVGSGPAGGPPGDPRR